MAKDLLNMKLAPILFGLLALVIITPRHCMADNFLLSPNSLREGQFLAYGNYIFVLQRGQCNLVLYDTGVAVWTSNRPPPGSNTLRCYATMQRDGNFVLYNRNGTAVWSSGTSRGQNNYVLILQPDRNVVIYGGSIWATGTNIPTSTSILGQNSTATTVNSTAAGGGDDAVIIN